MTAHRAFQFCKQYKRTTEFRRLCEIIRNHLSNLNKYKDQRDRPDLTAPETLQLYLDTRFEQLKIATELELWQVGQLQILFCSRSENCISKLGQYFLIACNVLPEFLILVYDEC